MALFSTPWRYARAGKTVSFIKRTRASIKASIHKTALEKCESITINLMNIFQLTPSPDLVYLFTDFFFIYLLYILLKVVCTGISAWESIVLLHLTSYAQFTRSSIKTSMRARLFLSKVAFALFRAWG